MSRLCSIDRFDLCNCSTMRRHLRWLKREVLPLLFQDTLPRRSRAPIVISAVLPFPDFLCRQPVHVTGVSQTVWLATDPRLSSLTATQCH